MTAALRLEQHEFIKRTPALGHAIATQGDTLEEIREMARDAVRCHFGDGAPGPMPKIIRLHFVRDGALAV